MTKIHSFVFGLFSCSEFDCVLTETASDEVQRVEQQDEREQDEWTGVSIAFHVLLSLAGLTVLWGQWTILPRILHQFDRNCVSGMLNYAVFIQFSSFFVRIADFNPRVAYFNSDASLICKIN